MENSADSGQRREEDFSTLNFYTFGFLFSITGELENILSTFSLIFHRKTLKILSMIMYTSVNKAVILFSLVVNRSHLLVLIVLSLLSK